MHLPLANPSESTSEAARILILQTRLTDSYLYQPGHTPVVQIVGSITGHQHHPKNESGYSRVLESRGRGSNAIKRQGILPFDGRCHLRQWQPPIPHGLRRDEMQQAHYCPKRPRCLMMLQAFKQRAVPVRLIKFPRSFLESCARSIFALAGLDNRHESMPTYANDLIPTLPWMAGSLCILSR